MDKSTQIDILRREHHDAINSFEFDRAHELTMQIERLQSDLQKDREFETFGNRTLDLDEQREVLLNERTRQETRLMSERTQIQKRFHDRYRVLQQRHTEELKQLAENQAIALERDANRAIPEVYKLEVEAKMKGKEHKYEEAKKLYNEAVQTKNKVIEARKVNINEYYEKQREKLIAKQKNELRLLAEKQETAIAEIDQKYTAQDEMIQRHMKVKELRAQKEVTSRSLMMRTVSPILQKKRAKEASKRAPSQAGSPRRHH